MLSRRPHTETGTKSILDRKHCPSMMDHKKLLTKFDNGNGVTTPLSNRNSENNIQN